MKYSYKNDQTGRSMIEMLGVLAIIGILSVGGIAGYSKAMARYKSSKTMDQVSTIVSETRTMFGNQADYTGLTNAEGFSLGIIPADMEGTSSKATNAFGGDVVLAVDGTDATIFSLSYAEVDQNTCASILTSDWGVSSGLVQIEVTPDSGSAVTKLAADLPLAPTDVDANCGTSNTVVWTYK